MSESHLMLPKVRASSSNAVKTNDSTTSPVLSSQPGEGLSSTSLPVLSPALSRTISPNARSVRELRSNAYARSPSVGARAFPFLAPKDHHDDPKQIILSSFAPRVAVCASADTERFIQRKGFSGGFRALLRSFGERIQGNVVIRDSIGGSKSWEEFGVRFIQLGPDVETPSMSGTFRPTLDPQRPSHAKPVHADDTAALIDEVLDYHLKSEDARPDSKGNGGLALDGRPENIHASAPSLYSLYLRKLLSSMPMVSYEVFSHPVACLIAISSHTPAPIETLRQLYGSAGSKMPPWVSPEYLRYYVLIHDEENDDITQSTSLYDQMKRHFGLHCHLLRLRSTQCVPTDDDSIEVPPCEWLSAEEETVELQLRVRADDIETFNKYIFESDATAIKGFLREMVTQSIIPFMEARVVAWNDQVASRRRGISGRFISLSKRWTGFSAKGTTASVQNPSGSNYNPTHGIYPSETPEATMRQLADYAFMLRDWKLSHSTYELLRIDFGNDKAWKYHAAANEMAAISLLLSPQTMSSRTRSETVDQLLDAALYSYLTRSSIPLGAIRCLILSMELLRGRGSSSTEDAAKWGGRLLELSILSPIAQAFITERMAECYSSRARTGTHLLGSRNRQAALWNVLASETWSKVEVYKRAQSRLQDASVLYSQVGQSENVLPFPSMFYLWENLKHTAHASSLNEGVDLTITTDPANLNLLMDNEESEQLSDFNFQPVMKSAVAGDSLSLETGYSNPLAQRYNSERLEGDGFE